MQCMSNGFYKYVAKQIVAYFQRKANDIRKGDRFCLRLDTADMVRIVNDTLQAHLTKQNIIGTFSLDDVYSTYTIKQNNMMEIVVAAKVNGMTDDFLATLRNAELGHDCHPILMITDTPNDSILSGTTDLSSVGMPFHPFVLSENIKKDIQDQQLTIVNQVIVESELDRKLQDKYTDKNSLFEYHDVLTVLERGYMEDEDLIAWGSRFVEDEKIVEPLKKVIRIATYKDKKHYEENREKEKEAFNICNEKIKQHKLDMTLTDVEFKFDNSKVLFYFTADGRIDFRELVKDLAAIFKTRIELRQIGVRDEVKRIGGNGVCGRELCCCSLL